MVASTAPTPQAPGSALSDLVTTVAGVGGQRLLWRNDDFRRLWIGQGVSDLGSAASSLAFPLVGVLLLHTSALGTALVAACSYLPQGLLALPAGPFVERRRKRPLMISADLLRVLLLVSLPVAQSMNVLGLAQLVIVAFGTGLAGLVFSLADQAHLPALVGLQDLAEAVSVQSGTSWIASTAGPAVGGWLVGLFGPARTLLIDAASFLVSAVSVWRIREPELPAPEVTRDVRTAVLEGIDYVRSNRSLRRLAWSSAMLSWSILFIGPVEILFLLRTLKASPAAYGIALAAPCVGGLFGSLLARRCVARWGTPRTLLWSGLFRGPWLLLVPLARPGLTGVVFVAGCWTGLLFGASIYNSTQSVYRQTLSPPELRSRINAGFKCLIGAGKPLAPLAGGLVAGVVGLRVALLVGALALCIAPLILDRRSEPSRHPEMQRI